jgi:hypothetical protein
MCRKELIDIKRYIVYLNEDYNDKLKSELQEKEVFVIWYSGVLRDIIAIETNKPLSELNQISSFKSIDRERIGRIDI